MGAALARARLRHLKRTRSVIPGLLRFLLLAARNPRVSATDPSRRVEWGEVTSHFPTNCWCLEGRKLGPPPSPDLLLENVKIFVELSASLGTKSRALDRTKDSSVLTRGGAALPLTAHLRIGSLEAGLPQAELGWEAGPVLPGALGTGCPCQGQLSLTATLGTSALPHCPLGYVLTLPLTLLTALFLLLI